MACNIVWVKDLGLSRACSYYILGDGKYFILQSQKKSLTLPKT